MREEPTVFGATPSNVPRLPNNATFSARYTHNFNFSQMRASSCQAGSPAPVAETAASAYLTSAPTSC
jgi:hypothetical protein